MDLRSKNLSYKQLSLLMALGVALFSAIVVFIITGVWYHALIVLGILYIFTFFFLRYVLDRFINRKIKVIYKLISQERTNFKLDTDNFERTINDIEEDVKQWAGEKKVEITRLQNNESFRKEFLMNLAHELRTPIFSIQGYIATLLDGEINNPEVNVRFLENAAKSTDRLSGLVDDLREISHYESHAIRLDMTAFSIQQVIKKVYAELSPMALDKQISTSIKKGCEGDFMVYADKVRIEQVLINLVQNAIKYGKQGGEVLAGIYKLDKKDLLIEIVDNGMGMLPEQSIRAFERFYRTDDARAADKHGNGLGLAIVKHIIEAHNQTISCRSQQGMGSTFSFTLAQDN